MSYFDRNVCFSLLILDCSSMTVLKCKTLRFILIFSLCMQKILWALKMPISLFQDEKCSSHTKKYILCKHRALHTFDVVSMVE